MDTTETLPQPDAAPPGEPSDPAEGPPPPFARQQPPLRRSATDRKLGGVAGGIATYLDVSPTVVRAAMVVVGILSAGGALFAYAGAWLLLPTPEDDEPIAARWLHDHGHRLGGFAGVLALALGALVVGRVAIGILFGWGDGPDLGGLVFLGLVGLGAAAWLDRSGRARPGETDEARDARRGRLRTVRRTTLLLALVAGTVTSLLWLTESAGVGTGRLGGWVIPASVLAVLVVGIALAPWAGWSWTLAFCAVLALGGIALTAVPNLTLREGIGQRDARPTTVTAAQAEAYRLGAGRQSIDLTGLDLEPGSTTTVRAELGAGALRVQVDPEVEVVVRGSLSAGALIIDGNDEDPEVDGAGIDLDRTVPALIDAPTSPETGQPAPAPRIVVDAQVGLGVIEIDRF